MHQHHDTPLNIAIGSLYGHINSSVGTPRRVAIHVQLAKAAPFFFALIRRRRPLHVRGGCDYQRLDSINQKEHIGRQFACAAASI